MKPVPHPTDPNLTIFPASLLKGERLVAARLERRQAFDLVTLRGGIDAEDVLDLEVLLERRRHCDVVSLEAKFFDQHCAPRINQKANILLSFLSRSCLCD